MMLALTAALAIVVQDHTLLRSAPQSSASELTALSQGDVVEIRGERAGYLKVYNYRRERGGFLKSELVRPVGAAETDAPALLAVLRFLRESPGSEALGISYGAAYLKAVPARALTTEPFDAIARMSERLADEASTGTHRPTDITAHLEVAEQFGIRMRSFERNGRMQVCYDGELFRRVLAAPSASSEERARATLGLTRPDCIDPNLGPTERRSLDEVRGELLDGIEERELSAMMRSRLRARRAGVWASIAYEKARRDESSTMAAQRALAELVAVHASDLGEDRRGEYVDAVVRVGAVRWAAAGATQVAGATQTAGSLTLTAVPGNPGQTCVALEDARRKRAAPLVRHCTYGIVWMASAQAIPEGPALVVAVQPLETWRELWVFHEMAGTWTIDVISPGADEPEQGYVEFAGFAPGTRRLLTVREVKDHGRFLRRFEELRLDDLVLVRQASAPELLRDFGRWQDVAWRRDTLALH